MKHQTCTYFTTTRLGLLTLFVLALMLGGCASLSPEQCKNADWRQIGYADGVKGLSGAQIDEHARACAPQGIRPDLDAYLTGRSQGLVSFCQPQNGFALGRRGVAQVTSDCPGHLKWVFEDEFNLGRQVYAIESELNAHRNQLNDTRHRMRRNEERINEIKSELARRDLNNERRTTLLNEYNRLIDQKEPLMRTSLDLEAQVDFQQRRLQHKLRDLGR